MRLQASAVYLTLALQRSCRMCVCLEVQLAADNCHRFCATDCDIFPDFVVLSCSVYFAAGTLTTQAKQKVGHFTRANIAKMVQETVDSVLGGNVAPDEPLMSLGLDSLGAVELRNALQAQMPTGTDLPQTLLFDYPSIDAVTSFISSQVRHLWSCGRQPRLCDVLRCVVTGFAVHAVCCISDFTLSVSLTMLLQVVSVEKDLSHSIHPATSTRNSQNQGFLAIRSQAICSPRQAVGCIEAMDAVTQVPLQRWDWEVSANAALGQHLVPRFGGWLSAVEQFDAAAFGISSVEAQLMDPQQRLLLELASTALSTSRSAAGFDSEVAMLDQEVNLTTACVAIGIASAEYNNYLLRKAAFPSSAYSATGGALSVASGRLAFTYNLGGAAVSVDTACSSSLVATHFVAGQLKQNLSSTGLTGGAGILLSPDATAMFHKAGMMCLRC